MPHPAPRTRAPLWCCVYFPRLPLESSGRVAAHTCAAVFEELDGLRRILLATPAAAAAGVRSGLSVNAALALIPGLQLTARDAERERRVLQQLAWRAEGYTSLVVIEPPAVLLLEIAASLRLFAGLRILRQRLLEELDAAGFSTQVAVAPTPLAATWLARAGQECVLRRPATLAGTLHGLPVECLDWPAAVTASLQGMGIHSVGDCLRMPRDGFARRFGAARLLQLDRALGRLPDPREGYRTSQRFCADHELDEEQSDRELLLAVCERLLQRLEGFLLTRQLTVQRLQFVFYHLQAPATPVTLGSMQAERQMEQWRKLLGIRLERVVLPAPVIAIRLRAGHGQPLVAKSAALAFAGSRESATSIAHLVECLGARIGTAAVHGVGTVAEHRPDYAWRTCPPGDERTPCRGMTPPGYEQRAPQLLAERQRISGLLLQRPLWMLAEPEWLSCRDGQPGYDGPLTIESGPERIESGWWDEAGIARDYYVALGPTGVRLWVFRQRDGNGDWYLHGIFG